MNQENILKNVLESYHNLIEHLKLGVYRSTPGPQGKFLEVNPALLKMLGCKSRNELLNLPIYQFYQNPKDRRRFSEKLSRKGVVYNEELILRRKNGSPLIVSEIAVAVRDSYGKVLFFEGLVEDITNRKQSKRQFDLQKTYLEKLFNAAPEAIALHNNHDRIVDINDEFTKMFGYTREEAIGKQINELVAPEELLEEAKDISHRVILGERIELESKRKRKDGVLIDVSILGAPIFHQGKQVGDYAIYRNITERKKAEEEIRIQKTYMEGLLNSAPEAIIFHDTNDIVVNVNNEFLKMFGYTREEAISKPINSLVAPIELKDEAAKLSDTVIHGHRVEVETKRRKKDNTLFHVSILGAPIFHQGKQIGVFAIYRDISDRKRTEEEILIQKIYFERLFNSAPEAILLHDNDDRVVSVNEEFVRMFNYSREEAIGRPVNELVAPTELMEEATRFSQMSFRGERVDAETKRKRKDGTLIDVSVLGAPVFHEGKQIAVYAIYRDITEHKRLEEERIREKQEAQMARDIQLNFLPKSNPIVPGYDIAGKSLPAMNVGGDYYDFIRLNDHQIAIGLGDVSGKGLAASLVMANLQATIRSEALYGSDPAHCLERANKLLFNSTDARTFISLFYGILDTGNNSLIYANAGQDPAVLFSEAKSPISLSTRGMALALTNDADYNARTIFLNPGDFVIFYSDGITEAVNDKMEEFGRNRIWDLVINNKTEPSAIILDKLFDAVHGHANNGSDQDDMTAILLKRI
ncbi:MAG: PAS domain S-box protein [Ignavibacteriales bacterium]|nr:PAS domain S-box protein [Ignavibacteriales bacterium]